MIQPKKSDQSIPDLYNIGCAGKITSFNETNDGRYLIVLNGISRFKIVEELENDKLYRECSVSFDNFQNDFEKIETKKTRKIIFIVGMPRSGTSLVEQIISSHNNVYGGGELAFLKNIIEDRFLINSKNENLNLAHFDKNILSEIHNEYIEKISQINNTT